ncbi:hypothetical protein [Intrasporangium sp. YIM S08009]|uniref:uridine kinase family protein n=1 Tax=Intrasporangium zincisolvens TaxID=3080018 RepID=UPI002B05ADFE|nr:hypothetical protein [Intrasporangium sp. YIM S08009]
MHANTAEPQFGPFRRVSRQALTELLAPPAGEGPSLVLVDGRSGAGKTTFAAAAADARGGSVVATDDVAWQLHPTDWAAEMLEGVVRPWLAGERVDYRPPGWVRHDRPGGIEVPPGADLVIEGVGAARAELAPFARLIVWVASDAVEARRRGIARDITLGRTPDEAEAFWDDWMSAEQPFLEAEQPWTRADLVVDGTAASEGRTDHVSVTDGPRRLRQV